MEFCRSALGVLILLIISTGAESGPPVVKVQYGCTAVLPCNERCSGVVSWTLFHNCSDVLAQCDQTSCRSVKEGYQMIYNQYLQGDLSLIITKADFSKGGRYTCDCDGVEKCDVELLIKTRKTPVQIKTGDPLVMELDLSVPVEVIYQCKREAGTSSDPICTVIGGSLQCKPEYKHRTSLSSSVLELREVKESDSGVYIIRDTKNNGDIHIYTVTVTDAQESMKIVSLVVFGVGALIVVLVGVGFLLFKKNMLCFKKSEEADLAHSVDSCNEQNIYCPEKSPLNHQQV